MLNKLGTCYTREQDVDLLKIDTDLGADYRNLVRCGHSRAVSE